jgi:hypothetical protein
MVADRTIPAAGVRRVALVTGTFPRGIHGSKDELPQA